MLYLYHLTYRLSAFEVRLNPGSHLKPHFGNGPRLSAHLSVKAPEATKAAMTVGDSRRLWVEGEAILFDDTWAS